ncbi:hypothetical protein FKM82_022973 [Ascaphus truei]
MELGVSGALLLATCVTCVVYFFTWRGKLKRKNMPPGPPPLPLLGNILQMSTKEMPTSLVKFSKLYGPVFTIYLSDSPMVVLAGYEVVKEAFVDHSDSFSARGNNDLSDLVFKDYDTPFDPTNLLSLSVSNVICSIIFGERSDYEDEKFVAGALPDTAIIWGIILCFSCKYPQEQHNPNTEFHFDNLFGTVVDLFMAGTETTSTTLKYSFLILLKYPDIERKVQEEIDHVIGPSRFPSVDDRSKMPYMDAVIHEIQRFADIIPIGVPHATSSDTMFRGYNIPKI